MKEKEEINYRIGWGMGALLVFAAIAADLIGAIPFMQYLSAGAFWVVAELYFHAKGVKTFTGKKFAIKIASWLISAIPFLQSIPIEVVSATIAIIIVTRIEDRLRIKTIPQKGVTLPRIQRMPLNTNGVRGPRKIDEEISLAE